MSEPTPLRFLGTTNGVQWWELVVSAEKVKELCPGTGGLVAGPLVAYAAKLGLDPRRRGEQEDGSVWMQGPKLEVPR